MDKLMIFNNIKIKSNNYNFISYIYLLIIIFNQILFFNIILKFIYYKFKNNIILYNIQLIKKNYDIIY